METTMTPTINLEARAVLERQLSALREVPDIHTGVEAALSEDERTKYRLAHELLFLAHDNLKWLAKRHPVYAREREEAARMMLEA